MTQIIEYYIKYPNGRFKLTPTPSNDEAAVHAFTKHWTAGARYRIKNPKRVLVKEIKEEILVDYPHDRTP